MDNKTQNEGSFRIVESNVSPEMNKIYVERLEKLFAILETRKILFIAPKIIRRKFNT